jgi:hypothetical protein
VLGIEGGQFHGDEIGPAACGGERFDYRRARRSLERRGRRRAAQSAAPIAATRPGKQRFSAHRTA